MNITPTRKILVALLCGSVLAMGSTLAQADDRGPRGKAWGHSKHHHHKHYKHKKHDRHGRDHRYRDQRTVYRERVIVREAPRYYRTPAPVVNNYYYPAPRSYAYSRDPAIVIGVDIPPVVIPLR